MSRRSLLVLAAGVLVVSACSLVNPPTQVPDIRLAGIQVQSIALDRQVFVVRLALDNPNTVKLKVASARLGLNIEDIEAGTGELLEGFDVPAGESGTASVRVITNIVGQGPRYLQWLMSGDATLNYRVSGYVDLVGLGLGRIPVDERGSLQLAPPPRGARSEGTTAL